MNDWHEEERSPRLVILERSINWLQVSAPEPEQCGDDRDQWGSKAHRLVHHSGQSITDWTQIQPWKKKRIGSVEMDKERKRKILRSFEVGKNPQTVTSRCRGTMKRGKQSFTVASQINSSTIWIYCSAAQSKHEQLVCTPTPVLTYESVFLSA